jgi:hypothetical protein
MLTASRATEQAAHRALELERVYQGRRHAHSHNLSISDENHHITEAIGDMYGDDGYAPPLQPRSDRPLSFVPALGETIESPRSSARSSPSHSPLLRTPSDEPRRPMPMMSSERPPPLHFNSSPRHHDISPTGSFGSLNGTNASISPPPLNRTPSEPAQQHFPLTDLDSTAAVAQELSNLQAIRRMSMDVHAADPDLPSFNSGWTVPSVAPSQTTDEEDPSRLFWVPASVHPELAPKAFETFIHDRVKTIKRSSLGQDALSPDMMPNLGGGGLSRKKSMLSRQVNDGSGYEDGAERLERKRSLSDRRAEQRMVSLDELEELASDPASLTRRLSIDSSRNSYESGSDPNTGEDTPILAPKPPGQTLKRSTRTTYRRGSQRKGGPSAYSKRNTMRMDPDDDSPMTSPGSADGIPQLPALPDLGKFDGQFGLTRVQTEPLPPPPKAVENFSRPGRRVRTPPIQPAEFPSEFSTRAADARSPTPEERTTSPEHSFQSRMATNGRSTAALHSNPLPVPVIIETPPPSDQLRSHSSPIPQRPERSSSIDTPPSQPPQGPLPNRPGAQRPQLNRPGSLQQQQQTREHQPPQPPQPPQARNRNASADHLTPQQMMSSNNQRTDALTFVPTYAEDKKVDKKGKKDEGSRKAGWGWLLGSEEKQKKEEEAKKSRAKVQKPPEKGYDNTRLDLLQTSIEGKQGRESLVLDRQAVQMEQDKKSARKPAAEPKKEKDGLFSSIFGGSKKKGDKDSSNKRSGSSLRGLSPDVPQRRLQPDVDYNWSRFSILEERAIYRMAHIKLANPRRELYSQVLLSNFMYSYLAKVQQMHPQIQIPQSAAQKQQQRAAQAQKKAEQQAAQQAQQQQGADEFTQYQRYQEVGQRSSASQSQSNEYLLD